MRELLRPLGLWVVADRLQSMLFAKPAEKNVGFFPKKEIEAATDDCASFTEDRPRRALGAESELLVERLRYPL